MALPLAEAFTARSLGVMWDNYKKTLGTAPYLGRQKFGTRKQDSLDLRFIKGKNGFKVNVYKVAKILTFPASKRNLLLPFKISLRVTQIFIISPSLNFDFFCK